MSSVWDDDTDIEVGDEEVTPLPEIKAKKTSSIPALGVDHEKLEKIASEVIEKVAQEIVPILAEKIIKEKLDEILKESES